MPIIVLTTCENLRKYRTNIVIEITSVKEAKYSVVTSGFLDAK
ncbi:hypothetical protein DESAMIL20_1199 [Desulfurella amilsii]|uniref:Uncharacterized protein n=2 Tax=Desulfurella amilsii TaxID=1562698 RepID=A0A1X4XVS0_9BACT|nr:hypothetical protein DESAMIL20_1199 [Desulfurella amilsii]